MLALFCAGLYRLLLTPTHSLAATPNPLGGSFPPSPDSDMQPRVGAGLLAAAFRVACMSRPAPCCVCHVVVGGPLLLAHCCGGRGERWLLLRPSTAQGTPSSPSRCCCCVCAALRTTHSKQLGPFCRVPSRHWCAPVGSPPWHSCCQRDGQLGFWFVVLCSCPCVLCGGLIVCCGLCVVLVCVCCVGVGTHTHACLQARLLATGTRGISVKSDLHCV